MKLSCAMLVPHEGYREADLEEVAQWLTGLDEESLKILMVHTGVSSRIKDGAMSDRLMSLWLSATVGNLMGLLALAAEHDLPSELQSQIEGRLTKHVPFETQHDTARECELEAAIVLKDMALRAALMGAAYDPQTLTKKLQRALSADVPTKGLVAHMDRQLRILMDEHTQLAVVREQEREEQGILRRELHRKLSELRAVVRAVQPVIGDFLGHRVPTEVAERFTRLFSLAADRE